jgi:hypothetical protein
VEDVLVEQIEVAVVPDGRVDQGSSICIGSKTTLHAQRSEVVEDHKDLAGRLIPQHLGL